ncbi:hypothetical protein ACFXKD_07150 [Nocardiopsis aegyptia]|uniref:hypothetical protein n=1 Tax=Nocardiopsis aegyptia TaxID=220378 RepID=UPI0036709D4F
MVQDLVLVAAGLLVMAAAWRRWFRRLERSGPGDVPFWASGDAAGQGRTAAGAGGDPDFHRAVALLVDLAAHRLLHVRQEHTGTAQGPVRWRLSARKHLEVRGHPALSLVNGYVGWKRGARFSGTTRELAVVVERVARSKEPRVHPRCRDIRGIGVVPDVPLALVPFAYFGLSLALADPGRGPGAVVLTAALGAGVLIAALVFAGRRAEHREGAALRRILSSERDLDHERSDQWAARPETGLARLVDSRRLHDPRGRDALRQELRSALGWRAERYTRLVDLAGALVDEYGELSRERRAERARVVSENRRRSEEAARAAEKRIERLVTEAEYRFGSHTRKGRERQEEEWLPAPKRGYYGAGGGVLGGDSGGAQAGEGGGSAGGEGGGGGAGGDGGGGGGAGGDGGGGGGAGGDGGGGGGP